MRSSYTFLRSGLFWLTFLILGLAGSALGSDTPADTQNPALRLASVRTYVPQQFRQSRIDYLSGEFPTQFP